ncbi:hypothetical protein [Paenibacillus antarcticus]|nr:hypothetical protein [Paenibacillus antarcticus]
MKIILLGIAIILFGIAMILSEEIALDLGISFVGLIISIVGCFVNDRK